MTRMTEEQADEKIAEIIEKKVEAREKKRKEVEKREEQNND